MKRAIVAHDKLPANFPTNFHDAAFWEALGRAVATFGFLEDVLGRAIFAFTGTQQIPEDRAEEEYQKWLPTLEKALTDALGGLINSYERAVRANTDATITNLDDLVSALKEAAIVRNVICHGFWGIPDDQGRSLPRFVDRKLRVFDTPIDAPYLRQLQQHAMELGSAVISTVTHMGWQFPGSSGPGKTIWR